MIMTMIIIIRRKRNRGRTTTIYAFLSCYKDVSSETMTYNKDRFTASMTNNIFIYSHTSAREVKHNVVASK